MNSNACFLLFLLCLYSNAQNVIVKGEIESIEGMPVANVSVVAYIDKLIAGYSFSNDNGFYELDLKNIKNGSTLKLDLNCLGFWSVNREIIFRGEKKLTQDFILTEKVEELNEVILEAWEKVKVNKDTVTFKAETYLNGSEQVVEDLLKNLPGVEVLNNGVIKVNGKTIDKLLIEGDDLFDKKYKLLSKNLDARNISEVQILNNFEDNPILKSFQQSDKVALNLKLKEDKKNVWFGNASIGLGTNDRYDGSANLGLLKKKFKFFNLFSLNNIQKLSLPQVRETSNQSTSDFQTEKRVEKSNNTLVNIDDLSGVDFSDNEDVFNDSFLNSLSLVTNLSENTKLRSLTYFGFDKVKKSNSSFIEYLVSPETIEYSEKNAITTKDLIFAADLELKNYSKKNTYYNYSFSFENNPSTKKGDIINNNNFIFQFQDDVQYNYFNHLNITTKLNENKLLSIYAYSGHNNTKQSYSVEPNILGNQISEDFAQSKAHQNSSSPLNYTGIIAEVISKLKKAEFSLEFLGSFDHDKINSTLDFYNQVSNDSLSNKTVYKRTTLSTTGKFIYSFSNAFKLKSSINLSQNYTNLNNQRNSLFFINPRVGLTFKKKEIGTLDVNYNFVNNLPEIYYLNENFVLNNYRNFSRGLDNITPSKQNNFSLTYFLKNYKKLFLINSYITYNFSDINFGLESAVSEVSSFNTYRILKGADVFTYNLGITRYLKNLPVSLKLNTYHSWRNTFADINNSVGKIENYTSNYRFQGTTYLNLPINFKFYLQYNYFQGQFIDRKTSNDYLEASFNSTLELSKKWVFSLSNQYYSIGRNNFLFTNLEVNLNPEKSRWTYGFVANNLSDINEFSNIYIAEYQKSNSSFKIVPRYFLLNIKYRF